MLLTTGRSWSWKSISDQLEVDLTISHVDVASLIGPDVSCFGVVAVVRDQHYKYRVNPIIGQNKDQIALVFPHIGNEPFYCSIFAKLADKKLDLINSMRERGEREREREERERGRERGTERERDRETERRRDREPERRRDVATE